LIDRKLLIASLNAQVPARDYLASFVKSDRLLGSLSNESSVGVQGCILCSLDTQSC
jgi:hypothetical protein